MMRDVRRRTVTSAATAGSSETDMRSTIASYPLYAMIGGSGDERLQVAEEYAEIASRAHLVSRHLPGDEPVLVLAPC